VDTWADRGLSKGRGVMGGGTVGGTRKLTDVAERVPTFSAQRGIWISREQLKGGKKVGGCESENVFAKNQYINIYRKEPSKARGQKAESH